MDELALTLLFAACLFAGFIKEAESRFCPYTSASGTTEYFKCAAYEYCCGRSCCKSATLTFYQLWYFWLSVILILLLCSGGGWWYRFKYRGHIYTQPSSTMPANAFYYPQADRVMLQSIFKDSRHPQQSYISTSSPYNIQPVHQFQYATPPPSSGITNPSAGHFGGVGTGTSLPPYAEPPPTYDSVFGQNKGASAQRPS